MKTNSQNVVVNVLDADTKELIQENFVIYTGHSYPYFYNHASLKGGTGVIGVTAYDDLTPYTIQLDQNQITALGYDFNSIKGNVITPKIDSASGVPFFSWVVNIYLNKR